MERTPTHSELVDRAVRWLRGTRGCRIVFAELATAAPVTPDAIGWNYACELVECKTSRSDFHRDKRKPSHRAAQLPGRLRWYMTPPGLIDSTEIPNGWGLVEVYPTICRIRLQALIARDRSFSSEVSLLVSVARRHELGVVFDQETGRFQTFESRKGGEGADQDTG